MRRSITAPLPRCRAGLHSLLYGVDAYWFNGVYFTAPLVNYRKCSTICDIMLVAIGSIGAGGIVAGSAALAAL
jgi:hypothetical protein